MCASLLHENGIKNNMKVLKSENNLSKQPKSRNL